ncbi:MAG: hypothetical protein E7601_04875 [Ruminococcaceae bacterium]|nr:hypothetical protein [Oscillospiraceae bacterium]MBQ1259832.1 hypothetical protein [Clostridia bacterium]
MVLQDEVLSYTPELLKDYALIKIFQLTASLVLALGFFFFLYVVNSVALTVISKKLKFSNPYIAWIPLASPYLEGKIYDRMKSEKLDKSSTRIHYLMLNFAYVILFAGSYLYNFITSINQCITIYETGAIPLELMSGAANPNYTAVSAVMVVLSIAVAYFRLRTLFVSYICFDKKKGMFFVIISAIFPFITPFLYFSLAKLTPVNTSFDKLGEKFGF